MTRVLVIGLDGANWDLLKPWAEDGRLPHINDWLRSGVWSHLESTIPPITGPAWVSFATGRNPGKHGCYNFVLPQNSLDNVEAISANSIQATTFYEILSKEGLRVVLINLPVSYPPKIQGDVITGLMTRGDNCIFPTKLRDEVPELRNYRIVPEMSLLAQGRLNEYINDVRRLEANRFECARKLFDMEWDLFFILFSGTDWVQHRLYYELASGKTNVQASIKLYEDLDNYIGWFMKNLPGDTDAMLMSDHGFGTYNGTFDVNSWLIKEGYLKLKAGQGSRVVPNRMSESHRTAENRLRLPNVLINKLIDHPTLIRCLAPLYAIVRKFSGIVIDVNLTPDVSQSQAYSPVSSRGAIYINLSDRYTNGIVSREEYETVRQEIIEKLRKLEDRRGKKVVKEVLKKEEVYSGSCLDSAPDILLIPEDYLIITSGASRIFNTDKRLNHHRSTGIFSAYGPHIKQDYHFETINIWDLAPTILHIFGVPVPKDMDGRVLTEIFGIDTYLAKQSIRYQLVDEAERVKKRIRQLKNLKKI